MAILAVQTVAPAGGVLTKVAAAAGGDSFSNTGDEIFNITNAHATLSRTVTFVAQGTCNFGIAHANHNRAVVILALTTQQIGPFSGSQFNDGNARVQVTYSDAAADLTVAVQKPAA